MVDVEIIELAGGTVAAEILRALLPLGALQKLGHVFQMLGTHFLLNAVSTEAVRFAFHVEPRFIDRVTQRFASITTDYEVAALCHESRHVTDRAADDNIDALHGNPAARGRIAINHQQTAITGGAC